MGKNVAEGTSISRAVAFQTGALTSRHGQEADQDFLGHLELDQSACWVVAGGLDGPQGGEVAAQTAVEAILASFRTNPAADPEVVRQHLAKAQQVLRDRQESDPERAFLRTTAVLLAASQGEAIWGRVGDSHLYFFRRGRLAAQTQDHLLSQGLASTGEIRPEEIRGPGDRNRLLRTLGQEEELHPAICEQVIRLQAGDVFLLCSDGFWELVTEMEMEVDLAKVSSPGEWLGKMQTRLLNRTLAIGASRPDNYCALAVFVDD